MHDRTAEIHHCVYLDVYTFCKATELTLNSREDQDTRMRGRTVIHVPHGRTIINDHKFRTQVLN